MPVQGKRIQDVAHRMHVAMPAPRDGVTRPPVIPPGVAAARARRDAGDKRRTEKDLQVRLCPLQPCGCDGYCMLRTACRNVSGWSFW